MLRDVKFGKQELFALIVVILILIGSFSTLAAYIADLPPDEGGGVGGGEEPEKDFRFIVKNASNTTYLKTTTKTHYEDGEWVLKGSEPRSYQGGDIDYRVKNYQSVLQNRIEIEPLGNYSECFIPVSTYTDSVNGLSELKYYPSQNTFYREEQFNSSYTFRTSHYLYNKSTVYRADPVDDMQYYSLPPQLSDRVKELAREIVGDTENTFLKAAMIQQYLRENYYYFVDYKKPALEGNELLRWFLFDEKSGNSYHFNTAFVMLARSVDVPCRFVEGYRINNTVGPQLVTKNQTHVWAEVGLDIGWLNFDATPHVRGEGRCRNNCPSGGGDGPPSNAISISNRTSAQGGSNPPKDLFLVDNADNTSYLKAMTGVTYRNGYWQLGDEQSYQYEGGKTGYNVSGYQIKNVDNISVTPLRNISQSFLPVSTYTNYVHNVSDVRYYPSQNIFYSSGTFNHSYVFQTSHYRYNFSVLEGASAVQNPKYIQLPDSLSTRVYELAENITEGLSSPFLKARAIQSYLRETYEYDENYERATNGTDPVEWFLFEEQKGVCANFNSALVVLARAVNVPARFVNGYKIEPINGTQVVKGDQAHGYAEVGLDVGWITFDGTPGNESSGCSNCLVNGTDGSDGGSSDTEDGGIQAPPTTSGPVSPEGPNGTMSCDTLFYVQGAENTRYLKNAVGVQYDGVFWTFEEYNRRYYHYDEVSYNVNNYSSMTTDQITIIPAVTFEEGFVPVSTYTKWVERSDQGTERWMYYEDQNLFGITSNITHHYTFVTEHFQYDNSTLYHAEPINDTRYTELPPVISNRTHNLAENITQGINSTYGKAVAIRDHLKNNYDYDKDYNKSPYGWEPVDWFLFEEEKGVCANFNSAFTVLARSADVPTRVVSGFKIQSMWDSQEVTSCQSHAWAEIGLEVGWITLDSTPTAGEGGSSGNESGGSDLVQTVTNITSITPLNVKKGEDITVRGTVTTSSGTLVDDIQVEVYIKDNKSLEYEGEMVGKGETDDGIFEVNCTIPSDTEHGPYQIMAKSITDNRYAGSWSDPQIGIIGETSISFYGKRRVYRNDTIELKGSLEEVDAGKLPGEDINIYLDGEHVSSLTTDAEGRFSMHFLFTTLGDHTFTAEYPGSMYLEESSKRFNVSVEKLTIESDHPEEVIRGEQVSFGGRLELGDKPIGGENVTASVGETTHEMVTDQYGSFSFDFQPSGDMELGTQDVQYSVVSTGLEDSSQFLLRARTELNLSYDGDYKDGYTVRVTLLDDKQDPVSEEPIEMTSSINYTTTARLTNNSGTAVFSIVPGDDFDDDIIEIECEFNGSRLYTSSKVTDSIDVNITDSNNTTDNPVGLGGGFSWEDVLLLLVPLIIGLASFGYAYKKGYMDPLFNMFAAEEVEEVEEEKIDQREEREFDFISFPEISRSLPLVWGVGEQLLVKVTEEIGDMGKLTIDEEEKEIDQYYTCYHTFEEKGEHTIKAHIAQQEDSLDIRIVDYKEEVEREYTDLLDTLRGHGVRIEKKATPTKLEIKLKKQFGYEESIEHLRRGFELAMYSPYELSRTDYERFMIAKNKVEDRVGREE